MITAFDPGVTTGVAIRLGNGLIRTLATRDLDEVYKLVIGSKFVVYENFATAFRISKDGLFTVRLCGGIIALAAVNGIPIKRHMPQQRYPFQKPAHQLLLGTKHQIHEEDALAHLLAYEHSVKKS